MITPYNATNFRRLFLKAMIKMQLQGCYGLGAHGCSYKTPEGNSCIVGQLLVDPQDHQPAMCALAINDRKRDEDSVTFRAILAHDCECTIDDQMAMLLAALQAFHDKAGRNEKRRLNYTHKDIPFTLEGFKAHAATMTNLTDNCESSEMFEYVRSMIKDYNP